MAELVNCSICKSEPDVRPFGNNVVYSCENAKCFMSDHEFTFDDWQTLMGQGEVVAWMDEEGCLHATLESATFRRRPVTALYTRPAPAAGDAVPNMFWDDGAPEESFAEDPCCFADAISDDMTDYDDIVIVNVRCAKSLPNRQMKVWLESDGSGGHDTKWEWVE